jgi:hypothetical protein
MPAPVDLGANSAVTCFTASRSSRRFLRVPELLQVLLRILF